jgi:hypothetical protein
MGPDLFVMSCLSGVDISAKIQETSSMNHLCAKAFQRSFQDSSLLEQGQHVALLLDS